MVNYYVPEQIDLHRKLLEAVRQHISQDPQEVMNCILTAANTRSSEICSALDAFVQQYGGLPLQYGICLANMWGDFYHYPEELDIRNGHNPFLYRYIS